MAKYFIALAACTILLFFSIIFIRSVSFQNENGKVKENIGKANTSISSHIGEKRSIFVPYWTFNNERIDEGYDSLIYFGITPGQSGIEKNDEGYRKLSSFVDINSPKNSYLTVRMVNTQENFEILSNKTLQQKIIQETVALSRKYSFDGIILDLEVSSLPFGSVVNQINTLVKDFYTESKKENLRFSITLYGDTFSRFRPYDVSYLSKYADTFYIMAYDFHKSNGNPGPNFPFSGAQKFGYDFQTMVADFLNVLPKEKITIVFGMFGYDWQIDDMGSSSTQAESLSLNQIKERFIRNCDFSDCIVTRGKASFESSVNYTDDNSNKHVVWYEDEESVKQKEQFLKEKGIESVSFWAYSFF